MQVRQLIEELTKFDPELDIIVDGYEGGSEPLDRNNIGLKYVDKDDGRPYFGKYGDPEDSSDGMSKPLLVVILSRNEV